MNTREVIDKLVSADIVYTYPLIAEIFNKKAIRDREGCKNFAIGFSKRSKDINVIIPERIAEGDQVLLFCSFSAKRENEDQNDASPEQEYSWKGISLFRFDESGKNNCRNWGKAYTGHL